MIINFKLFEFEWYEPEDKLKLENCKKYIGKYIIFNSGDLNIPIIELGYIKNVQNNGWVEIYIYRKNKNNKYIKHKSGEYVDRFEILKSYDNLNKDAIEEYENEIEVIINMKKYNL